MQLLLILFLPIIGKILSSPLDKGDMELLDLVFRDGDESDISRSQRDITGSSVACDDNSSEEDYNPLFNDEESEEDCLDFLPPIEHPCFMRLILLRSPLLKQDPCANFSIVQDPKLKATKSRKCVKRTKAEMEISPILGKQNIVTNSSTNNTTEAITTTSEVSVLLAKSPPNVSKKLAIVPISQEVTITTEEGTTSTDDNSTTTFASTITEEDLTTTTISPTTIITTTAIPITLSTTGSPNHLKSLRSKIRNRLGKFKGKKGKKPRVPDPPKIKLDAATQPSEVIQVIFTTEVGELKLQPNDTTTVSTTDVDAETTTEINLIEETTNEVETTTQETELEEEMETTETEEAPTEDPFSSTEEPCNDTDEQDTNLCPQFLTPPEENGNLRSSQLSSVGPAQRQRKVKNYVEPILYEGNFIKPRQRIGLLAQTVPQRRDYYVTNKQIMPRPKPKYRKRLPHSIYMNNIVRGLKCVDAPRPLRPYWGVKRLTSRPYAPLTYNPQRYGVPGTPSPPPSQSPAPFSVPVSIYHQNPNESEEDFDQEKELVGSKSNYFDTSSSELWQGFGASNSNVDPCQLEHEHLQRRQQHIHKPSYQKVPKEDQQSMDYAHQQQQMPENFFT
ncbi:mucin-3B isoform X2 [Drosophila tropicalis]|uniref:mucin-3B isoform X2 n=1 Tax=Drosophila tropicalis TaxID=46794 RepID=UPI0035ABA6DC